VLAKTHPEQLVLFQTFLSDEDENGHGDEKYSNTIELYDAVPKYFSNPRLMDRMRKDGKYPAIPAARIKILCAPIISSVR
jgi:hypothetical protein